MVGKYWILKKWHNLPPPPNQSRVKKSVIFSLPSHISSSKKQNGGGRVITGSFIPVSAVQNLDYFFRGLTSPEPLVDVFRQTEYTQRACSTGNCNANVYTSHNPFWTDKVSVKGFPSLGIPTKIAQNSWSGELITPPRKYIPKSRS